MPNYSDDIPDYSKYTVEQLRDAEQHVDREKYPVRLAMIQKELQLRGPLPSARTRVVSVDYHQQSRIRRLPAFVIYLFYRYYSRGPEKVIPYEAAIIMFDALLFLNVLTILGFAGVPVILPFDKSDPKWMQTFKSGVICLFPIYLLTRFLFPKKEIVALQYDDELIQGGNLFLVVYSILSLLALGFAYIGR